jgi:hypothetical protein
MSTLRRKNRKVVKRLEKVLEFCKRMENFKRAFLKEINLKLSGGFTHLKVNDGNKG